MLTISCLWAIIFFPTRCNNRFVSLCTSMLKLHINCANIKCTCTCIIIGLHQVCNTMKFFRMKHRGSLSNTPQLIMRVDVVSDFSCQMFDLFCSALSVNQGRSLSHALSVAHYVVVSVLYMFYLWYFFTSISN